MDKAWLQLSRFSEQYRDGAQNFVELARENLCSEMIGCPCVKCRNLKRHHYETVYEHLVIKGMDHTYTVWVFHGERPCELNSVEVEMLESCRMFRDFYVQQDVDLENPHDGRGVDIQSLVDDAETPLYPGCTACTKMSDDMSSRDFTPQSQQGSGILGGTGHLKNSRCQLLHWYRYDEEEIVAEGKISSTDPTVKVHHMPLGRDCWKVWVDEVYMGHLALYRPTDEFRVLKDAMGSTVAWPKSSIRLI